MNEGIAPSTPGASSALRVRAAFTGENGEFRRLVTRGALLELVTFGFYRFWLATNIRWHLWSNSSVAGDALESTGTGRELLIGFLFALAILVPIYLVYFVIGIEAERWQAFASVPLGLMYYGFWQFAIYRARRYRLTRALMEKLGRSPKPLGDLLLRISGFEKDNPLSIFASHPMTADRMAMLEAAGSTPLGEPLLSFGEWRALKAICK